VTRGDPQEVLVDQVSGNDVVPGAFRAVRGFGEPGEVVIMDELPEQVAVGLDWGAAESAPVQHANQVIGQVGPPSGNGTPDGIYVALGIVHPPVIPPDGEGRAKRIAELANSQLPVSVLGGFHLSREVAADLVRVLTTTIEQYDLAADKARAQAGGLGG
jgi:hypothetical protein